jgi:hypothetical protein
MEDVTCTPTGAYQQWEMTQGGDPDRYEVFKAGWDARDRAGVRVLTGVSAADFLREAAALLRRAGEYNERTNSQRPDKLHEQHLVLSQRYADLAAIARGVTPPSVRRAGHGEDAPGR